MIETELGKVELTEDGWQVSFTADDLTPEAKLIIDNFVRQHGVGPHHPSFAGVSSDAIEPRATDVKSLVPLSAKLMIERYVDGRR